MRKKLIEVALPLDAINKAAGREKSIRHGHPSTLHLWWARRPLAAARAVIFGQMVDHPSSWPDLFPTEKAQEKEQKRLFNIIEDLVEWENTTNEEVLDRARAEIWASWRRACAENADHPRAKELFDRNKLPAFHDPFAGGGSLPLEAQRLGLEAYATDLNPVAVLINKAMLEIPPKFAGRPPMNPEARKDRTLIERQWKGAQGLAEDVRYYGRWMREEAEKHIGHLYPKITITEELAKDRKDLKSLVGQKLTVIAWLWVRTVKSPNPAFADIDVPLASTFMLSTKAGKEAYVHPVIEGSSYRFSVRTGKPKHAEEAKNGTKLARGANFKCLMSGTPISGDYIKSEGAAGRMGVRLMAIVAEGERSRIYLPPSPEHEASASINRPSDVPLQELPLEDTANFWCTLYGLTKFSDLFTARQLVTLTTLADLVHAARERIVQDARWAGMPDDGTSLADGGRGATAYADAVAIYLAFALSKVANIGSSIASWMSDRGAFRETFARQAIPMVWDFAEANPLANAGGSLASALEKGVLAIEAFPASTKGTATQADAASQTIGEDKIISTDPPYYDNIGYADLSDFFYVWLRRSLRRILPDLFSTMAVPKAEELVATPFRHGGKENAERFFLTGMTAAMHRLAEQGHPAFPVTVYYAFKQAETEGAGGTASTGWETFLAAVIEAGFAISGTWPMRTEGAGRIIAKDTNALASSIVLVCRPRPQNSPIATRREFIAALKAELPQALAHLQRGNIAPVDLAQAAIGPGMAVYTRYSKVVDTTGAVVPVRDALTLINQTLDEVLADQEGDFDSETRWAVAWFSDHGFSEGPFGDAHTYFLRYNTAENALVAAGVIKSGRSKVRLLGPDDLPDDWDPTTDARLTVWEIVHHLIKRLNSSGESGAANLVAMLGTRAEVGRELAYRLYSICERRKRYQEALAYNALVQSWPEIVRLARESKQAQQTGLFVSE